MARKRRMTKQKYPAVQPDAFFKYSTSYVLSHLRGLISTYSSQAACAKALGISPAYLSDILKLNRDPGPSVLKALGFKKQVVYVRLK